MSGDLDLAGLAEGGDEVSAVGCWGWWGGVGWVGLGWVGLGWVGVGWGGVGWGGVGWGGVGWGGVGGWVCGWVGVWVAVCVCVAGVGWGGVGWGGVGWGGVGWGGVGWGGVGWGGVGWGGVWGGVWVGGRVGGWLCGWFQSSLWPIGDDRDTLQKRLEDSILFSCVERFLLLASVEALAFLCLPVTCGYGSELSHPKKNAGFSLLLHLPGSHFGVTRCLTHSHVAASAFREPGLGALRAAGGGGLRRLAGPRDCAGGGGPPFFLIPNWLWVKAVLASVLEPILGFVGTPKGNVFFFWGGADTDVEMLNSHNPPKKEGAVGAVEWVVGGAGRLVRGMVAAKTDLFSQGSASQLTRPERSPDTGGLAVPG